MHLQNHAEAVHGIEIAIYGSGYTNGARIPVCVDDGDVGGFTCNYLISGSSS